MSTAAASKFRKESTDTTAERPPEPSGQWLAGFVLLGALLAPVGSWLVYWRYHLDPEPNIVGLHFAGFNVGYLLAVLSERRFANRWTARGLVKAGTWVAIAALLALPFVPPPVSAFWRILALIGLGISAGLLTITLLRAFEGQYRRHPFRTASTSMLLFGIGASAATLLLATIYQTGLDQRTTVVLALAPAFFLFFISRRNIAPADTEAADAVLTDSNPRWRDERRTRDFRTLAALLFRSLLFVQVGNEWAIAGWLPLFLIGRVGTSPGTAMFSLAFYFGVLFTVRWAGLRLYARMRKEFALVACAFLALTGLILLSASNSLPLSLLGIALAATGLAPVFPLVWRDLDERFSFQHEFYRGALSVAVTGAMGIPWLMSWIAASFGIGFVMLIPGLGAVLSLLLSLLILFEAHLMVGGQRTAKGRNNGE